MSISLLQWCFVAAAFVAILRTASRAANHEIPRVWSLVWSGAWLILGGVALLPKTTDLLAATVGIGRGVDLVVYIMIGVLLWMVFHLVVKVEGVQWQLTQLMRADALRGLSDENTSLQGTKQSTPSASRVDI